MVNSESPYKRAMDGPSRQLLWELGRLQLLEREAFQARLDRESKEKEVVHKAALAAAAAHHENIRREADAVRQREVLQMQEDEQRRLETLEAEVEQLRRANAEREVAKKKREAEIAQRIKDEKAEEFRALAEIEEKHRRLAKEKADAEAAKQAAKQAIAKQEADLRTAEANRKAKEAASVPQAASPVVVQVVSKKESPKIPQVSESRRPSVLDTDVSPVNRAEHVKYLSIHQRSKDLRKWMADQYSHDASMKEHMGDMRRTIRKCIGQLTDQKGANSASLRQIRDTLLKAVSISNLQIDVTEFIAYPLPNMTNTKAPACLIFQLIHFAKIVIAQLCDEASRNPKVAEPIGTIASQIFSYPEFQLNGISFIDILFAKFHIVCPLLFGVYCQDLTTKGRVKMGWRKDGDEGAYVTEARHFDRMAGLGAGFASLTTRNYDKSKFNNPCPPYHFWRAVAAIVNIPPIQVTRSHLIVLRAMISRNQVRIVELFGDAGRLLLRKALVELPTLVEEAKRKTDPVHLGEAKEVAVLTSVTEVQNRMFL